MFNSKKIKELESKIDTLLEIVDVIDQEINGEDISNRMILYPTPYNVGLKKDVEELSKSIKLIEKYLGIKQETIKAKPEETKYVSDNVISITTGTTLDNSFYTEFKKSNKKNK